MPKLVRITTIPVSMQVLLKGQLKYMQKHGFEVTMISSDGPEVKDLIDQEGCPHIAIPFTRKISPWTDIRCLIQLIRILKKVKPDIIHTHTPKAGLLGMWAAYFAGVPVRLHTIAGLPWMETKGVSRWVLKNVERITALPANCVYPNSIRQREFLIKQGIAVNKLKVLGHGSSNGINTDYFNSSPEINNTANKLLLSETVPQAGWVWIFVGRLVKDKGLGELLEAFQQLQKEFSNDRLWLLGEAEPELDPLDKYHTDMLNSNPAIRSWGFIKDIRPYLAASKVLVFPSYREGFPNVPLQAGAMGCMLLLSDINGCNEIVDNNVNGVLVAPKNIGSLTEAMFNIRRNPAKRDILADAVRVKIRNNYDQQYLWNLIKDEYQYWLKKTGVSLN